MLYPLLSRTVSLASDCLKGQNVQQDELLFTDLFAPAVIAPSLLVPKRQPRDVVHNALDARLARCDLTRRAGKAGRDIHTGVLREEVAWSE